MRRIVHLLLLLFVGAAVARGDGAFFGKSQPQMLREARPRIDAQRAVIKFDGKTETLLVESLLNGPKGVYGWVVPLPRKPGFVKAVKPEYVSGSFQQVKPVIKHLNLRKLETPLAAAVLAALLFLSAGLRYRNLDEVDRTWAYLGEAALVLLACLILGWFNDQHQFGKKEGEAAAATADTGSVEAGIDVTSYGTVGSYEVSALSAETGAPVRDWLAKRDIPVPKEATR